MNDGFPEDVNSGRPGGGSVLIRAGILQSTGTTGVIDANGDDGNTFAAANAADPDEDGSGGGGGAGGTVIVITSSEDLSDLTINSTGGDGAGLTGVQVFLSPDGGGGGGSGGNVMLVRRGGEFSATPTIDVAGGALGATQGTPDDTSTGGDGAITLLTTPPLASLDCPLIATAPAAPGGVQDAIIWFNPGQNVTYNGTNQVSAWNDFSSSNFTATTTALVGITGTTPDYIRGSFTDTESTSNPTFNFNPSISFNEGASTDDYLAFTSFNNLSTGAITSFSVVNFPAASPNDQTIFSYLPNDSQDDELDLGITNDGGADGIRKRVLDNSVDRAGDLRDDITRIIATDYDNTDANIYENNGAATNAALVAGTFDAAGIFVIGQDLDDFVTPALDDTRELQGQIGEVIYFSRILSDTERQQVSSYLGIKYGITIDQTTDQDYLNSIAEPIYPVSSESANYAAYDNDIAGIGRDDGSALNQLRSKSINSDAILTGSQTNGFSVDRQFVVWGNNNGGTTFNTTEISTGITNRIQREWRVAATNSLDPVDFIFDLSSTTNTPALGDNVALVIDDDGDFSNGFLRIVSANSWDGSTATFENVTVNDDEVMTVATVPSSPGGVTGLVLWLKSDAGVTTVGGDGTEVTAWNDQSGAGSNFASQVFVTPTEIGPTFDAEDANFNGNPSFGFTDNYLAVDDYTQFPIASDFSFISVLRADATATDGNGAIVSYGEEEFDVREMDAITIEVDNGNVDFGADADVRSQTNIMSFQWDEGNGAADAGSLYLNAVPDGQNPIAITEPNIEANLDFVIGQESDNNAGAFGATDNYIGDLGEILLFDSFLSASDLNKIESYLAIKYGITLNGGGTDYIASDGEFIYEIVVIPADYNNDIAGIGRDDISELDQRKSLSVDTDAIVTMALTDNSGTFASPNAFTSNLSFLAWGNDNDDNGTIEDVTNELPSNVLTRLDREWRVQEKGTVGNVTLEIDISGVDPNGVETDFTGRTASSFMILIDDGGDFSNGITRSYDPTSYDAVNEILTFDVDFEDDDIFTVATSMAPDGPGGVTNNLNLWLKGDAGVTSVGGDGTEVTNWADQSGNGLDFASQVFSPGETQIGPTLVSSDANFNDYPSFTFTDNYLARDPFNLFPGTDLSAIIVSRPDLTATGNNQAMLSYGAEVFQLRSLDNLIIEYNNGNNTIGSDILGFTNILSIAADDLNDETNVFLNGTADVSNPNATTLAGFANNDEFVIGYDSDSDQSLDNNEEFVGSIAEIILYDSELTDTERTRIESYLAIKYGITLNSGNYDYESADGTIFFPGNSDADFASHRTDVAGIGRDDNSVFEQSTSSSINSTAILSVTKNGVFNADGQFFTWAHNGSVVASSTATDFPSGTEGRLDRVWRVKLTNSPGGTIDMTFDLSGTTVDQASDLRLLVDSDGDFSDATVLNPAVSQNGNNYTFSAVGISSFSDKDFFTLASIDDSASPLPLDFLSFSVLEEAGNAALNWKTTNEVNVDYFEIERSGNGTDFETIGQLKANNVSDAINSYDFVDNAPLQQVNYYRIKQVDFDGAFEYTWIEFVLIDGDNWQVNVYPNPTTHSLNVTTSLSTSGRLKVIDMAGKVLMDYPTQNDRSNEIDVSSLTSGIYQLEFNSVLGIQRVRFVKD